MLESTVGHNLCPRLPLSDSRYFRLRSIAPKLIKVIHNSPELLDKLEADEAISETDCQELKLELTNIKKNSLLVDAIRRRSNYSYECFEEALRETKQDHVADFLKEGQVIEVHAETNIPKLDKRLANEYNEVVMKELRKTFDSSLVNGMKRVPVLAAEPGQSIVFFIYCKKEDDMIKFTKLYDSGELKRMIEDILKTLLKRIKIFYDLEFQVINLRLDDENVILIQRFTGIHSWMIDRFRIKESTSQVEYLETNIKEAFSLSSKPEIDTSITDEIMSRKPQTKIKLESLERYEKYSEIGKREMAEKMKSMFTTLDSGLSSSSIESTPNIFQFQSKPQFRQSVVTKMSHLEDLQEISQFSVDKESLLPFELEYKPTTTVLENEILRLPTPKFEDYFQGESYEKMKSTFTTLDSGPSSSSIESTPNIFQFQSKPQFRKSLVTKKSHLEGLKEISPFFVDKESLLPFELEYKPTTTVLENEIPVLRLPTPKFEDYFQGESYRELRKGFKAEQTSSVDRPIRPWFNVSPRKHYATPQSFLKQESRYGKRLKIEKTPSEEHTKMAASRENLVMRHIGIHLLSDCFYLVVHMKLHGLANSECVKECLFRWSSLWLLNKSCLEISQIAYESAIEKIIDIYENNALDILHAIENDFPSIQDEIVWIEETDTFGHFDIKELFQAAADYLVTRNKETKMSMHFASHF